MNENLKLNSQLEDLKFEFSNKFQMITNQISIIIQTLLQEMNNRGINDSKNYDSGPSHDPPQQRLAFNQKNNI